MNEVRRKIIANQIENIQINVKCLQEVLDEEIEAYDNMPEGLQGAERGMISEHAQECLESAIESLEDAIMSLEDID